MELDKSISTSINLGLLKPGENAYTTFSVYGGPGNLVINNDRIKADPLIFNGEITKINLKIEGGAEDEIIWDNIIVQYEDHQEALSIIASWTNKIEIPASNPIETNPALSAFVPRVIAGSSDRLFSGRKCKLCGRYFSYDPITQLWETCSCTKYEKIKNTCLHFLKESKPDIKELRSYIKETWDIIVGKEKWNNQK